MNVSKHLERAKGKQLEPIKPPAIKSKSQIQDLIKKHKLNDDKSETRKRLLEGFQLIRNKIEYNKMLKDNNLNINVDDIHHGWIQNMVRDKLGGTIIEDKVTWNINGEIIQYDPFTGIIS